MRRAVITGYGVISSIGSNKQEVLESLRNGTSGIEFGQPIPDTDLGHTLCSFLHPEYPKSYQGGTCHIPAACF